jgi:hypothetical protein
MNDSYDESYRKQMTLFMPQLWDHLDTVPSLPLDTALAIVKYLLSLSCQASHIRPIQLGRRSLLRIPRAWLLEHLVDAASTTLDLSDNWEYRRYLEICSLIDPVFAEKVVQQCLSSDNIDIREASDEFAGRCAEFAHKYADSYKDSPL